MDLELEVMDLELEVTYLSHGYMLLRKYETTSFKMHNVQHM